MDPTEACRRAVRTGHRTARRRLPRAVRLASAEHHGHRCHADSPRAVGSRRPAARRRGADRHRRRPTPTPAPSGTTARALDSAMADELVGPLAVSGRTRHRPSWSRVTTRPDEMRLPVGPSRRSDRPRWPATPGGRAASAPPSVGRPDARRARSSPWRTPDCRAARTPGRRTATGSRRQGAWPGGWPPASTAWMRRTRRSQHRLDDVGLAHADPAAGDHRVAP